MGRRRKIEEGTEGGVKHKRRITTLSSSAVYFIRRSAASSVDGCIVVVFRLLDWWKTVH